MNLTMVYMTGGAQLAVAESYEEFGFKVTRSDVPVFVSAVDAVSSLAWRLNVSEIAMFRPALPQEHDGVMQMRAQNSGITIPGVEVPRQ